MSDRMRKAMREAGKLTVTIEGDYRGNLKYSVHEQAFRLDAFKSGELRKEQMDAAEDPDALILETVAGAVRENHVAWEARQ